MGQRGPQRKVGSVRWKKEVRKKQELAALSDSIGKPVTGNHKASPEIPENLPACPECLAKPVRQAFYELVTRAVVSGWRVSEYDTPAFAIAAGFQADLYAAEGRSVDGELSAEEFHSIVTLKSRLRKDLMMSLKEVGATPPARVKSRIAPDEKPKTENDPWSDL